MKIYQIEEYGGRYEDYYHTTVGTFLSYENAEKYMEKCKAEFMKKIIISDGCRQCSWIIGGLHTKTKALKLVENIKKRCNLCNLKIEDCEYNDKYGIDYYDCESRMDKDDEIGYNIKEYDILDAN